MQIGHFNQGNPSTPQPPADKPSDLNAPDRASPFASGQAQPQPQARSLTHSGGSLLGLPLAPGVASQLPRTVEHGQALQASPEAAAHTGGHIALAAKACGSDQVDEDSNDPSDDPATEDADNAESPQLPEGPVYDFVNPGDTWHHDMPTPPEVGDLAGPFAFLMPPPRLPLPPYPESPLLMP